jgi:hypothetical protein
MAPPCIRGKAGKCGHHARVSCSAIHCHGSVPYQSCTFPGTHSFPYACVHGIASLAWGKCRAFTASMPDRMECTANSHLSQGVASPSTNGSNSARSASRGQFVRGDCHLCHNAASSISDVDPPPVTERTPSPRLRPAPTATSDASHASGGDCMHDHARHVPITRSRADQARRLRLPIESQAG